jgi:hypothetical protein
MARPHGKDDKQAHGEAPGLTPPTDLKKLKTVNFLVFRNCLTE